MYLNPPAALQLPSCLSAVVAAQLHTLPAVNSSSSHDPVLNGFADVLCSEHSTGSRGATRIPAFLSSFCFYLLGKAVVKCDVSQVSRSRTSARITGMRCRGILDGVQGSEVTHVHKPL